MDRRGALYLPLTADVVAAHLAGDVVIGLYPLLTDNTCHFLVADFDGPAAMLDALAYSLDALAYEQTARGPTPPCLRRDACTQIGTALRN